MMEKGLSMYLPECRESGAAWRQPAAPRLGSQRHDGALLTRTTSATGAVQISLVLVRRIRLDDQRDVVDGLGRHGTRG